MTSPPSRSLPALAAVFAFAACHPSSVDQGPDQGPDAGVPLAVVSIAPSDGTVDVDTHAVIQVVFSEPPEAASVTGARVAVTSDGTAVSGALAVDGVTVTFTPARPLHWSSDIAVTVAADVRATSGAGLAQSLVSHFRTRAGRWIRVGNGFIDHADDPHVASDPQLAVNASGEAVVLWSQRDAVWARRLDANGVWADAVQVSTAFMNGWLDGSAALDDAGNVTLVWREPVTNVAAPKAAPGHRIAWTRAAAGGAFAPAAALAEGDAIVPDGFVDNIPTLGIDHDSGAGFVSWNENTFDNQFHVIDRKIQVRSVGPDGIGAATTLLGDASRPARFAAAAGGTLSGAIWVGVNTSQTQYYTSSAFARGDGTVSAAREFVEPSAIATMGVVGLDVTNKAALVLWRDSRLLTAKVLDDPFAPASTWSEAKTLSMPSSPGLLLVGVEHSDAGVFYVLWEESAADALGLVYATRWVPSTGWEETKTITPDRGLLSESSFAVAPGGSALVILDERTNQAAQYYSAYTPASGWSKPVPLPWTEPTIHAIALAADGSGRFLAVYKDVGDHIFAYRFE